jgi:hypothetical protein
VTPYSSWAVNVATKYTYLTMKVIWAHSVLKMNLIHYDVVSTPPGLGRKFLLLLFVL